MAFSLKLMFSCTDVSLARSRFWKVSQPAGQLSRPAARWPASVSSFTARDPEWRCYINSNCRREGCKLPVLHGLQSPGWPHTWDGVTTFFFFLSFFLFFLSVFIFSSPRYGFLTIYPAALIQNDNSESILSYRGRGWMNRDVLLPKSSTIPIQTHLTKLSGDLPL